MLLQVEKAIKEYIQKHDLIQRGDDIVVGVSGGADSMALLYFLYKHKSYYDISIKAAHVHHGIREEAEKDARYVEEICRKLEIPFFRYDCNIKTIAKEKGITEEEAGRIERYNFFISLTNDYGKIATAHNMNDQAETLIMRFLRGTGVNGLGGIPPKRGRIIRPLLNIKRKDIEAYCKGNGIIYRDDHTNFMPIYTRNKIRLECIPYIEQNINANIIELLGKNAENYRENESFLKQYTDALFDKCIDYQEDKMIINMHRFQDEHIYMKKRLLLLCIEKLVGTTKDITARHIESLIELLDRQSGKQVILPYGLKVKRQYSEIIILKEEKGDIKYDVQCLTEGTKIYTIGNTQIKLQVEKVETVLQKDKNGCTIYIDYDKIKDGLTLRTRRPQDYIILKSGRKTLKKYFIDEKIPKDIRDELPLITDGNEVIWIVGHRLSMRYYLTEDTQHILRIKLLKDNFLEDLC